MYKKVSHTIVEEHFDHPAVLPAGLNTNIKNKDFQIYNFSGLRQIEKDSIIGLAALSWRIRSLVISITSGDKDIDLLELRMSSDIDKIAKILASTYGDSVVTKFAELLNALMLSLVGVIIDIKAGTDTTASMSKLSNDTTAFAECLASINSEWPADVIMGIFTRIENLYMDQTRYRMKQEWASGVSAADAAYNILVAQQENGDPSLAEIFSSGIIESNLINNIY